MGCQMRNGMEKVAILVDSGTDVPVELQKKYGMYQISLCIHYTDGDYLDGVDITPREVYERFATEIPKTSLPTMEDIHAQFARIAADGYEKVIVVTISSGLSGTCQVVHLVAKEFPDLQIHVVDTKNIGIGAGFSAMLAAELLEQGKTFAETVARVEENVAHTKVFFCVDTLEYLRKGGRIGLVAGAIGTVLNIKPVISCNEDGIYYTVAKARGRANSLKKAIEQASAFAKQYGRCRMAVVNGDAAAEAAEVLKTMRTLYPNAGHIFEGQISPALVVHTGPGLIGIGVQRWVE